MELTIEAYSKYATNALKNTMDEVTANLKDYPEEMMNEYKKDEVIEEVVDGITNCMSVKDAMLLIYAYEGDVIKDVKEEFGEVPDTFQGLAYFVLLRTIRNNEH